MLGPGGFCIVLGLLQLQWIVEAMQVRCWRSFLPRVILPVVRMSNLSVDSSGVQTDNEEVGEGHLVVVVAVIGVREGGRES